MAKTGRVTESRNRPKFMACPIGGGDPHRGPRTPGGDLLAIPEVHALDHQQVTRLDAGQDLDAIRGAVAKLHLHPLHPVAADPEDEVPRPLRLHGDGRDHHGGLHHLGADHDLHQHPRHQPALRVRQPGDHLHGAERRVHPWRHHPDLALDPLVLGKRRPHGADRGTGSDAADLPLGQGEAQLDGVHRIERHQRSAGFHQRAGADPAQAEAAVEGGGDAQLVEPGAGEGGAGLGGLEAGAQVLGLGARAVAAAGEAGGTVELLAQFHHLGLGGAQLGAQGVLLQPEQQVAGGDAGAVLEQHLDQPAGGFRGYQHSFRGTEGAYGLQAADDAGGGRLGHHHLGWRPGSRGRLGILPVEPEP